MSINVGDIVLEPTAFGFQEVLALTAIGLVVRHFKLVASLALAVLPKRYVNRVLHVFERLNNSSKSAGEDDSHSGTPRRPESPKPT